MAFFIGCDAHKKFSQFALMDEQGQVVEEVRVMHSKGVIRRYLQTLPEGSKVALETVGNWYLVLDCLRD